MLKQTET